MKTRVEPLKRGLALAMPLVLLASLAVSARMETQPPQPQDNAVALMKYEWKMRTEIRKDGETKRVEVAQVRYDSSGQLQKTIISDSGEPDLPKFGLRRRIAKNRLEDFREKIESLGALAKSYANLPADQKQRFMANAAVTPADDLMRLEGRNVLQTGDSMTLFVEAATRKQRRIEIQTSFEQKPVRIVTEFHDLPAGGPTYVSRSEVNYDGTSIAIVTENFDYVLLK